MKGIKFFVYCASAVLVLSVVFLGFGIYENIHCHKTAAKVTYVGECSNERRYGGKGEIYLSYTNVRGVPCIDILALDEHEMNRFRKGDEITYYYFDNKPAWDLSISDNAVRDMALRVVLPGVCAAAAFAALNLLRDKQRGRQL